jgi:ribosomal protein S1
VEILRIDRSRGRVALDLRRRPLQGVRVSVEGFSPGDEVTGWVKELTAEGAILAFEGGGQGVIRREDLPGEIRQGSVLTAAVTSVDAAAGRIELKPVR